MLKIGFKPIMSKIVIIVFIIVSLIFPLLVQRLDYISILTLSFIYIILALGLNIIVGFCGLLALGFAAFYGIGAYTTALLTVRLHFHFLPVIIFVIGISILFGILCGAPVLRLRGDYLAIVTLGFGEIVRIVFNNLDSITNGPRGIGGITAPNFFGFVIKGQIQFYYLVLIFVIIEIIFLSRLDNSRIGRAWIAIREDEVAASSIGINITELKLLAFVLGSIFAGLAGTLFAHWQAFVSPESFTFNESVFILCMVIIGGIGSIPGVIIGSIILTLLPELLREILSGFQTYRMLFFGLALILMMIFRPQGIFYNPRRRAELLPASEFIKTEEDESIFDNRRK